MGIHFSLSTKGEQFVKVPLSELVAWINCSLPKEDSSGGEERFVNSRIKINVRRSTALVSGNFSNKEKHKNIFTVKQFVGEASMIAQAMSDGEGF